MLANTGDAGRHSRRLDPPALPIFPISSSGGEGRAAAALFYLISYRWA